jgi:Holliday junction resolvase
LRRYQKGAHAERELLEILHKRGYAVIRAAGSGVSGIGPDVVAIKDHLGLAFECKAHESAALGFDQDHYNKISEWQHKSGYLTYIAWRMNNKGWYFLMLDDLRRTPKGFTVTRNEALAINRRLEHVIDLLENGPNSYDAEESTSPPRHPPIMLSLDLSATTFRHTL